MTAGAAACVTIATALLTIGPDLMRAALEGLGRKADFHLFWRYTRYPLATGVLLFMLGSMYHFLPNAKLKWRFVTPGTLVAVTLFIGTSLLFNVYVSHFHNYAKTYGALGTVVILLFWLYISSLMLLLGAEIDTAVTRTKTKLEEEALLASVPPPPSPPPEEVPGGGQVQQGS
jgi:membrane protein